MCTLSIIYSKCVCVCVSSFQSPLRFAIFRRSSTIRNLLPVANNFLNLSDAYTYIYIYLYYSPPDTPALNLLAINYIYTLLLLLLLLLLRRTNIVLVDLAAQDKLMLNVYRYIVLYSSYKDVDTLSAAACIMKGRIFGEGPEKACWSYWILSYYTSGYNGEVIEGALL